MQRAVPVSTPSSCLPDPDCGQARTEPLSIKMHGYPIGAKKSRTKLKRELDDALNVYQRKT